MSLSMRISPNRLKLKLNPMHYLSLLILLSWWSFNFHCIVLLQFVVCLLCLWPLFYKFWCEHWISWNTNWALIELSWRLLGLKRSFFLHILTFSNLINFCLYSFLLKPSLNHFFQNVNIHFLKINILSWVRWLLFPIL